jgi:hypothetical protein
MTVAAAEHADVPPPLVRQRGQRADEARQGDVASLAEQVRPVAELRQVVLEQEAGDEDEQDGPVLDGGGEQPVPRRGRTRRREEQLGVRQQDQQDGETAQVVDAAEEHGQRYLAVTPARGDTLARAGRRRGRRGPARR